MLDAEKLGLSAKDRRLGERNSASAIDSVRYDFEKISLLLSFLERK